MEKLAIRTHFPMIADLEAKNQVYLDSAATAQKPEVVIKAVGDFYRFGNFPVRRSVYRQAEVLTAKVEKVRDQICQFLGAGDGYKVVFTASATDSINLVARSFAKNGRLKGGRVVVTAAEHHSNFAPWAHLAPEFSSGVKVVPFPERGFFKSDDFDQFLEGTKLFALTLDSNVIGPVWEQGFEQLKNLIKKAHQKGVQVLLDATQAVAHTRLDLKSLDADFVVFSGHKMAGPNGVGVLCAKHNAAETLAPIRMGGGNLERVSSDEVNFLPPPHGLEAGTLPVAQIIGLSEAIKYLDEHVLGQELLKHEAELCAKALECISQIPDVTILGNPDFIAKSGHVVSFSVHGIHPHDLAWSLGEQGVLVRAGDHCAKQIHKEFKVPSSIRVSFFVYNNLADVEKLCEALKSTIEFFRSQ